jgi:CRP-like cAMP-binding protein
MTGGVRSATVQAQTDILTLEIPAKAFYQLLQENLLLATEFEKVALSRIKA